MIQLAQYLQFWQQLAESTNINFVHSVTSPEDIARKIAAIKKDQWPALFVAVPAAVMTGTSVDDVDCINECIVFIFDRYDPQRMEHAAFAKLNTLQFPLHAIIRKLLDEAAVPCSPMHTLDFDSISIMAVTDQYANTAGWSIAFNFRADFDALL